MQADVLVDHRARPRRSLVVGDSPATRLDPVERVARGARVPVEQRLRGVQDPLLDRRPVEVDRGRRGLGGRGHDGGEEKPSENWVHG